MQQLRERLTNRAGWLTLTPLRWLGGGIIGRATMRLQAASLRAPDPSITRLQSYCVVKDPAGVAWCASPAPVSDIRSQRSEYRMRPEPSIDPGENKAIPSRGRDSHDSSHRSLLRAMQVDKAFCHHPETAFLHGERKLWDHRRKDLAPQMFHISSRTGWRQTST